jgi:hypothetical protein
MFTINSTRINGETLTANTTFTLSDKTELTIDVPMFMPQNVDEVFQSLANREASEQLKCDVTPVLESIKSELDSMDKKQVAIRIESINMTRGE